MANRSRRSSINLAVDTSQKVRPASVVPNEVPQFVGAMRGINPFAGDMSQAFNQFFGNINQSLNSVMETERAAEIDDLKQTRIEVQKTAEAQALQDYEANRGNKFDLTSMNITPPTTFQADGQTLKTDEWKAYGYSYSKAIGRLNGNRLYNNMIEEAASQNITPEGFDQFTSQYFTNNYAGGTGDPYHDVEMQSAWKQKTQEVRHTNQIEVVKRMQAKRVMAAAKAVYSYADTGSFSSETYHEAVGMISKANPTLTNGQARAKTIGIWIEGAKKTKASAQKLVSFLHREDYSEDGAIIESLADRFPAEMALHEQKLLDGYQKFVTLDGTKAATAVGSAATTALSMPDGTMTEMKSKLTTMLAVYEKTGKLDHIAGVPSSRTAKIRSDLLGGITKIKAEWLNTTRSAGKADGSANHYQTKEQSNSGSERILAELNVETEASAMKLGTAVRNLMDRNNNGIHPVAVQKLTDGLSSGDMETARNALKAIKIIDPTGSIIAKEFKDNPHATFLLNTQYANFDQVWGILNDENFKTMAGQMSLDQIVYGDESLPTGSDAKQEIAERVEEVLFGSAGDGTMSVGEQILGNNSIVSFLGGGDDVRYSPTLRNAMSSQALLIAAQHKYQTGTNIGTDKLRERLAVTFKGKTVPFQNPDDEPMLDFEREVGTDITRDDRQSSQPINTSEVTTENARYGNSVMAPWGETQNTVENMTTAVEDLIQNGLYGLQADGLDSDNLQVRPHPGLRGTNNFVIMNLQKNQPLVLPIKRNIQGEERFDPKGESKFMNPNQNFKLTGDPKIDKELIQPFVHPSIALIPVRKGGSQDGEVMFYELGMRPFFTDPPDDFIGEAKLKELIKTKAETLRSKKP